MLQVVLALALLCSLATQAFAGGNETVNTIPQQNNSFMSNVQGHLRDELPAILSRHAGGGSYVHSGGLITTSGSCTASAIAVDAMTRAGNRVTADGAGGTVAINFSASPVSANCANPGTDTCWVVASAAGQSFTAAGTRTVVSMPTLGGSAFNRVGSSNLYADCSSSTTSTLPPPALPADSVYLFKVGIVNGAITTVTDLRQPASFVREGVYNVKDPLYGAVGDGTTDDTAAFQALFNSNGYLLTCPKGDYKITSTLTITQAFHLRGEGTGPGSAFSAVDGRFGGCALSHHFNGTFLDMPGINGNAPAGFGLTLENLLLRQTYGDGTSAAGTALRFVAASDSYRHSWVNIHEVSITGGSSVDHWTYGVYVDGSAAVDTGNGLGVRDYLFDKMWITSGSHSSGAVYLKTAVTSFWRNVQIEGDATTNTFTLTGSSATQSTQRFKGVAVASTGTMVFDYAQFNVCWECSAGNVQMTANSVNNEFWGQVSNLPTLDLGCTNGHVYSVGRVYACGTTAPAFGVYQMDGNPTHMRIDAPAATASYLDFYDDSVAGWYLSKPADASFAISHNSLGNIAAITTAGIWTHKKGTAKQGNAPTYGVTVTVDCSKGDTHLITVTNNSNFTITTSNMIVNQDATIIIRNSSGGAMGTITWDASVFKMAGAFTNPANSTQRAVIFRSSGAQFEELARTAADVTY